MTSQVPALGINPLAYEGVEAVNPANVIFADRAPTGNDINQANGTLWVNQSALTAWIKGDAAAGQAQYIAIGTGATGGVTTLTGGSGGAISPTAGNINVAGTANQITTTGAGSTITWSLPNAITAPGSLTATTSLAATTTVTAGTNITATAGNIAATAGSVSAGTTVTAGTGITATTGDITATAGNVIINGAAKQLRVHGGAATDFIGTAVLVNGTVDVTNTNIAATDRVFVTRVAKNASTAYGNFLVTITAATKFNITSCKSDTTTETNDASTVNYFIVRQV